MNVAENLVLAGTAWLIVGGTVAVAFMLYGVDRILDDARDVYLFRVLVAPGVVLIWPIVIWRWYALHHGRTDWRQHHSPHRRLAGILELAMALALIVVLALSAFYLGDPSELPVPEKISEIAPFGTIRS